MPSKRELLDQALASLPSDVARAALAIVEGDGFRGVIPYAEAKRAAEEMGLTMGELMLLLVPFATAWAEPAISNYRVGAVAQGSTTGSLYFGANMEFVGGALSFTIHAEQSACTNAWINGEEGLSQLAVSAAPCGYCRQFLYEITTAEKLPVLLEGKPAELLTSLLPEAFGPADLGVTAALMSPADHGLLLDNASPDPVVAAALAAANASYAPYTNGYSGVAVLATSGEIYAGRLTENAAYNPSMSPLESALTMCSLAEEATDSVSRVVLVQVDGAIADQTSATAAVVDSLRRSGPVELEVLGAHAASP
jgi:cytidine deaminase